jgi:hypothetical protein
MGDSDPTPPSSSPQRQPQPFRPWFAPDRILALATLALVGVAIWQHFDTVDAVRATNRLAEASENAANDRRRMASAELVMKMDATLNEPRYEKITDDIQSHNSNFHLPSIRVEEYIGTFDEMGYFIANDFVDAKIAYEWFSYDIEKAWCNVTVQETIRNERATDKSKIAQTDPTFGDFERIAKQYLATDGLSCNDLDNLAASTSKKQRTKRTH